MCPKKTEKTVEKNDIDTEHKDAWLTNNINFGVLEENFAKEEVQKSTIPISTKFIIGYLVLGIIFCSLLSSKITNFISFNKIWLLFILMSPCLYGLVLKLTSSLQNRNRQLAQKDNNLSRLIRSHTILSKVNHAILRQRDIEKLLTESCQIVLEEGKFSFVWAGLCHSEAVLPETLVQAGVENNYLENLLDGYISSSASERQEPALTALRKKQTIVINNIEAFSRNQLSWQTRALENGYQSIAAFPLKTQAGKSGVIAFYSNQKDAFFQDEVKIFRLLALDISCGLSEIEQKDKLFYLATYDIVTNLPNRDLFEDRLKQSLILSHYDNRRICVAVATIVNFDQIVAQQGQEAGDKLLQTVVKYLLKNMPDDNSLGMLGNNEIGIMLVDTNKGLDLPLVMHELLNNCKLEEAQNERAIPLQAGIVVFPQDGSTVKKLIKLAKEAMKAQPSPQETNCKFHSKEIAAEVKNNLQIAQQLQYALEKDEFVLYFQPIIDLQTRKIVGVEALTRWPHQKLGEVSPIHFFAVAERSDLMLPLGIWILKSACLQLLEWKNKGFTDLFLAVNISLKQLLHPKFLESLKELFEEIKFNPKEHQLCLEISEKVIGNDQKQIIKILAHIRDLGLKIFIDDYGTGPTSLFLLNEIPRDLIKIDAMFIRALGKESHADELVKGVIALANGLSLGVIAEGVETENQLKLLQKLDCKLAQGYFFSPPGLAKNITSMLGKTL